MTRSSDYVYKERRKDCETPPPFLLVPPDSAFFHLLGDKPASTGLQQFLV